MLMKKLTLFSVLLTLILTGTVFPQNIQNDYKKIDYIHVNADQLSSFIDLAAGDLAESYQQLIDEGNLQNWRLYFVEYPGGEKNDYNFVSIASASDLATFEELFSSVSASPYIPSVVSSEISSVGNTVTKMELWKVQNAIVDSTNGHPSKYMTMDYMDVAPGKNPDYLMLEEEVAKPIHSARIDQQIMAGWEVYSLIAPGGVEYGYNFATGNFYDKLEHVEYGFTNEIINQAMGTSTNIPELFNTIYETRNMVKVELWKLVANTE